MALISSQAGAVASFPRPSGAPERREEVMSLKEYDVEINGHKTTLQLSDEDAEVRGLDPDVDSNDARAALELQALADTLAAEEDRQRALAEAEAKERAEAEAKARAKAEQEAAEEKERAEAAEKAKAEAEKAAEPKAARRPANKAAPAPENKAG